MRGWKFIRVGVLAASGAVVALCGFLAYLHLSGNFHAVVAGEVYRSAQVTAADLKDYQAGYGIRSVLNLRGAGPGQGWYDDEIAASAALGLEHVDFAMNASQELRPEEAARLIALMRDMPKPLLVHCRHGSDRTGAVAVSGSDQGHGRGAGGGAAFAAVRAFRGALAVGCLADGPKLGTA